MIRYLMMAALVTQTYGGSVGVIPNLSDHDCAESVCVIWRGESCETADAHDKADRDRDEVQRLAWVAAHPKEVAECKARSAANRDPNIIQMSCDQPPISMSVWGPRLAQSGDIIKAQCVK